MPPKTVWLLLCLLGVTCARPCMGQISYVARFTLAKEKVLAGEPLFCVFSIQNIGTRPFAFSFRTPNRVLNPELRQEPRFTVVDKAGCMLPDPAPKPCGGARGSVVYGSVMLPPGQMHSERWLVNQWARLTKPGHYRLRAERRLPLHPLDPASGMPAGQPAAFALAINELELDVLPATEEHLQDVLRSYLDALDKPDAPAFAESVTVVTTLPRPFLLPKLEALASRPSGDQRWDRKPVLEGLARLGTPAAWEAIARIACRNRNRTSATSRNPLSSDEASLRGYAILLLAEKADRAFLPELLHMVSTAPEDLRGDVLRALGFFHDQRANQVLFEKLHSPVPADRINAILGLKNLESKDVIPALLAMLEDPEPQVRQVTHFALQQLTGEQFKLSSTARRTESTQVAKLWHAWWREHGATFVPVRQPACHDW